MCPFCFLRHGNGVAIGVTFRLTLWIDSSLQSLRALTGKVSVQHSHLYLKRKPWQWSDSPKLRGTSCTRLSELLYQWVDKFSSFTWHVYFCFLMCRDTQPCSITFLTSLAIVVSFCVALALIVLVAKMGFFFFFFTILYYIPT